MPKMTRQLFILFLAAIWPWQPAFSESAQQKDTRNSALVPSRAEELKKRRLEKRTILKPEEPSGFKKAMAYLESRRPLEIFSIRYKDFYPRFGNISSGSGFAPGIRFYKSKIGGSPLSLETSLANSFRDYRILDLHFGQFNKIAPDFFIGPPVFGAPFEFGELRARDVDRDKTFAYMNLRYRYLPQEDFYGLGRDSLPENRSDFLQEDFFSGVDLGHQLTPWLAAGFRVGYHRFNIEPGTDDRFPSVQDLFVDAEVPGLDRQPDFLQIAGGIFLNYTDTPGNPHNGGVVGVSFGSFRERGGNEFDFTRLALDIRQYIPLGSRQRILALRWYSSFDDPGSSGRVPFYLQNTIGGHAMLRGFPEFRFRDENIIYVSSEYRWEPAPAFEIAFFYDTGKVYPHGEDFAFEHLQKSIGIGLRFKMSRKTLIRFDIGRSTEGTRLQFRFGPAF